MQSILARYSHLAGDRELAFKVLCELLSEHAQGKQWSAFTTREWSLFEKMAVEEGVAAMAYYILKSKPGQYSLREFDRQVYQVLSDREAAIAVRNAVLFRHLGSILQKFQEQGIPVILLKGADLAQSIYPEIGLRWMDDLDLLITREDFSRAVKIAGSLGYHEFQPEAFPGLDRLISYHAHLVRDGKIPVLLDIHWAFLGSQAARYSVPMQWFWQNVNPRPVEMMLSNRVVEEAVYTLNPTANLLYLAAHQMLQHGGESASLHWLLDLHHLVEIRREEIDWPLLASQARVFGWSGALASALEAAQSCFATPFPGGVISSLREKQGQYDDLVNLKSEKAPTRILHEWKNIRSLHGWGQVLQFLALVFPTPAYLRWRYHPRPQWTWPFYYPYRWLDIARDGWLTLRELSHSRIKNN